MFFATILFAFIAAIGDATAEYLDIGMGGDDDGILDFLVWNIAGVTWAAIQLAVSMLLLQAIDNLRIIRENTEK